MGIEIDFLAVGDGERSGDAIALRFGDLSGTRDRWRVVVIDGGYTQHGESVVDLVKTQYRTDVVDLVVSTHPDEDHARGLVPVLEKLRVGQLWMHRPWERTAGKACLFNDPRVTDDSVSARLWRALSAAKDLEVLAQRRGIPIVEPFQGVSFASSLFVLGPSVEYYESLIPHFRCTPEPKSPYAALLQALTRGAVGVATRVLESLSIETLTDEKDEDTSAENNSGTVLLLAYEGQAALFTADVGIPALTHAANFRDIYGFPRELTFIQVPHHGSHRNVGPTILDRLIGPRRGMDEKTMTAIVSAAAKGAPKHPSKRVTNAFRRRGAPVFATQGVPLWHHQGNAPDRANYSSVSALPFFAEVGDEDE